ncbi:18507_t:CDS:1, partial [Gigaspora rosea]
KMSNYHCRICKRNFSTSYGLIQHANAMHQGMLTILQPIQQRSQQLQHLPQTISRPDHNENLWSNPITRVSRPEYDKNLWSNPITRVSRTIRTPSNYVESLEDIVFEEENICDLDIASDVDDNTSQDETNNDEMEEELQITLKNNDFDPEDLQGTTLNDALDSIEGKYKPECIAKWPNNTYRDFMELIVE